MTPQYDADLEQDLAKRLEEILKRTHFFPLPEPGFDPLTASPEQLSHYGLPAKPNADTHPARYAFWHELFSPPLLFREVMFSFAPLPQRTTLTYRRTALGRRTVHQSSPNWSGAYIAPRDRRIFNEVHGAWQVPTPSPPAPAVPIGLHEYRSSTWIGLDGQRRYYHSSLPQIGTAQFIEVEAGVAAEPTYSAWWQWWVKNDFSQPPVTLSLAVKAHDAIMASVIVDGDRQGVRFMIKNVTTGHIVGPFGESAPPQAIPLKVSGATAEWVMERPAVWLSDVLYDLPNYNTVLFNNCLAMAASPRGGPIKERRLQGAKLIDMYEVRRNPQRTAKISVAKLINERQVMTVYR